MPKTPDDPLLLHECFERAANRWPDAVALEIPAGPGRAAIRRTYAELQRESDAVARLLRPSIDGEAVVAILIGRGNAALFSAQLGALKAGAAHACIDPAFPDGQIRDILRDSAAVALLTDSAGAMRAAAGGFAAPVTLDLETRLRGESGAVDPLPEPSWTQPGTLAYLIYTSGTTGRPKGVMIEHGSIVNLVAADLSEFGLVPGDRVAQTSSSAYDSSIEEVWLAFAAGATLVVADEETARLGPDLVPWLQANRITVLCPTPTLLRATGCEAPDQALPDLRLVYVGGEALPPDVASRWARGRRLVNGYGPTEASVTAVRGAVEAGEAISIGTPVPGVRAWILNDALEEVADGVHGELCLGGAGLARGYRSLSDLTARKFPMHPRLGRIYRTGDLAHKHPDGRFFCDGRIDSQVKLHGYRIELEAIEARLAECGGVREAACRVQADGGRQLLVALIVPDDRAHPPAVDRLIASLRDVLPAYMVPARIGFLDALPRTVGGKLNRTALPVVDVPTAADRVPVAPRTAIEGRIAAAFGVVLGLRDPVSVDDDFFADLGGDSVNAAVVISQLRDIPTTASLTVRDLYEARTVAGLAARASRSGASAVVEADLSPRTGHPRLATLVQAAWLLTVLFVAAPVVYVAAMAAVPAIAGRLGLAATLLLAPLLVAAAGIIYTPAALLIAVAIKKLLIGRYRPLRAPVWGSFFVRHWIVTHAVRMVPWSLLEGTTFQQMALRALGARIGRRVHLHRGVDLLQGGWDLLEIGDDVTINRDASIHLVELERGDIVVGPVSLGAGCTLDVRAGLGPDTCLGPGACLTTLSFLPRHGRIPRDERWDGIPATPAGPAPSAPFLAPDDVQLQPLWHGFLLALGRLAVRAVIATPSLLLAVLFAAVFGVDEDGAAGWLSSAAWDWHILLAASVMTTLAVPATVVVEALVSRLLGPVAEGTISRWSPAYVRVWLKAGLVDSAGTWLSGTLFWPAWLRWAGMTVGPDCEISTIIDVVPELVEIGRETFMADGIYLGPPRVYRGTVTLAKVRVGAGVFLGNHVVIPAGQHVPDGVLLGVCTVVDEAALPTGTSWFGHPPFALPRHEVARADRSVTHDPSFVRYWNRVCWELLRFALPVPGLLVLAAWLHLLGRVPEETPAFVLGVVPISALAVGLLLCLMVCGLKWLLLGRVRPGEHPLWSCWCSRWDFLYVAWGFYARTFLSALEGTLLLSVYLRAMGARIGSGVVLGGGFAQVVDPDMLRVEDEATVDCHLQAHTFEDRVLKVDYVTIGRRARLGRSAVLMAGAEIGAGTRVAPHSVVMKKERLLAGRSYAGCPSRETASVPVS